MKAALFFWAREKLMFWRTEQLHLIQQISQKVQSTIGLILLTDIVCVSEAKYLFVLLFKNY